MNPIVEKIFIASSAIAGVIGIVYLFQVFPTQATYFVIAAAGLSAAVFAMIWFFTRKPA